MFSSFSNSASLNQNYASLANYRVPPVPVFPTGFQVIGRAGVLFPKTTPTSNSVTVSNLMYGTFSVSGTFVATSSSSYNIDYSSGLSFNNVNNTMWASYPLTYVGSPTNTYNSSTGLYNGTVSTTISGTARAGEYLQIQCPFSFIMKTWSCGPHISASTAYAKSVFIAGSTDGNTWDFLGNILATTNTTNNIILSSNNTPYNYYRFVVNKIAIGEVVACMSLITFSS